MTPELHRPVRTERIGAGGLSVTVEASPAECRALADRLAIPALQGLACDFLLRRTTGDVLEAAGALRARVVRTCVVTLEDFETEVSEGFVVHFVPAGTESDDPDPEAPDEIPYDGDLVDLGEAAVEQLALALDPYPRAPDAMLPETDEAEEADASGTTPFAGLAALRRAPD